MFKDITTEDKIRALNDALAIILNNSRVYSDDVHKRLYVVRLLERAIIVLSSNAVCE